MTDAQYATYQKLSSDMAEAIGRLKADISFIDIDTPNHTQAHIEAAKKEIEKISDLHLDYVTLVCHL